ncbi:MAG: DNA internalization-related competence protein ComEC/Rec2 [Bacillota bacterium]|nr:DNA internalization-related competence protein ComEC/Rec2 [Bacillota bacterium]
MSVTGGLAEGGATRLQLFWHAAALLLLVGLALAPSLRGKPLAPSKRGKAFAPSPRGKPSSIPLQVLAIFALVCGAAGGLACLGRTRLPDQFDGWPCAVQGVVTSVSLTEPGEFSVCVTGAVPPAYVAGGEVVPVSHLAGKTLLIHAFNERPEVLAALEPGQCLSVWGNLSVPKGPSNPGGFDYRLYLLSKGISGALKNVKVSVDAPSGVQLRSLLYRVRRSLYIAMRNSLPDDEGTLLAGVVLGDVGAVSDETLESFRQTGLSHVLAVSGLHVQFVLVPVEALFRRISRPGKRNVARALTLALYSAITGMQPSVIRSSIMAFLPGLALSSARRCSGTDGLAIACLAIVVANPLALFDPGLQLSALATLGLVALPGRPVAGKQGWPSKAAGLVSATFSAQAFALPVLASTSDWPLIAFVANPLLVPPMGMMVTLGTAGSVLAALLGPSLAGRLVLLPAGGIARLSCMMVGLLSRLSAGSIPVSPLTSPQTALYYAALAAITRHWRPRFVCSVRNRPWASIAIMVLLIALGLALGEPGKPQGALRLTFIDVGQGDSALVETPGGSALLVDAGTEKAASGQIVPLLRRWGYRGLDCLVITHRHADHAGGASILLERFGAGRVLSGPSGPASGEGGVVVLPSETCQVSAGQAIIVGKTATDGPEFGMRVLWPDQYEIELGISENDRSLVLTVEMGAFSCLLMGDAGGRVEQALLGGPERPECYALKVGHHGSGTSTGRALLEAANPRVAIISVGPNSFGHPGKSTLSRLGEHDTLVLRTDRDGAVVIVTDGRRVKVGTTRRRESTRSWGITGAAEVPRELSDSAKADQ